MIAPGPGEDPADDFMEREKASLLAEIIIRGMFSLPPRQQEAMLWHLKSEVLDVLALTDALMKHGVDLEAVPSPTDKVALGRLRSLRTVACKKMQAYVAEQLRKEL